MSEHIPGLIQRAAARLQQRDLPAKAPAAPLTTVVQGDSHLAGTISSHVENKAKLKKPHDFVEPRQKRGRATISPTTLAARGIVLPSDGLTRTVQEFRAIKRHILSSMTTPGRSNGAANRIVLVTSARIGDGKTFTAINLALALALEKDTRVLLVDADAYHQSSMKFLGIAVEPGWLDVVSDHRRTLEEVIVDTNVPGLSVLPSGNQRGEIPEIMSSNGMKMLLENLEHQDPGRVMIIDSLPCLASTEPSILASLAGQTIFVVAAHQTSREDVEASLRLLGSSPSVKLVLNKLDPLLSEQFKGYGYGYGGAYSASAP